MLESSADIRTLNSLTATTLDSMEGYIEAAKDTNGPRFGEIFTARASERRNVVEQLQCEVTRLGRTPEDDGTALAGAHRIFMNLKVAVSGRENKAIINEVERGEDHILRKFQIALKDTDLSIGTRAAIQDAFGSIRRGHDQMRDLKHSMEALR